MASPPVTLEIFSWFNTYQPVIAFVVYCLDEYIKVYLCIKKERKQKFQVAKQKAAFKFSRAF